MKLKLTILFIIISSMLFSANFEFSFGISAGTTLEFSHADYYAGNTIEAGARIDSGLTANGFLDIGANFELPNAGALSSISLLFETGYYYYKRVRTINEKLPEYNHRYFYHNLILGILPRFNFNYGISLGIGAGIFLPLYSETGKKSGNSNNGLSSYFYDGYEKFNFERISYMYKIPIMPYIKLNLEKNFYMSERWAFKIGANLVYNFGMEFDMDNIKKERFDKFDKYKFSSLDFELFLGFGFGRPK